MQLLALLYTLAAAAAPFAAASVREDPGNGGAADVTLESNPQPGTEYPPNESNPHAPPPFAAASVREDPGNGAAAGVTLQSIPHSHGGTCDPNSLGTNPGTDVHMSGCTGLRNCKNNCAWIRHHEFSYARCESRCLGYFNADGPRGCPNGNNNPTGHDAYWCDGLFGGGWTRVRHVEAGNTWHPARDRLSGTETYGGEGHDSSWSVSFASRVPNFDQFLFATGDCQKWLAADKDEVIGEYYANSPRRILASSTSDTPYHARWYNRAGALEDPWISLTDHGDAIGRGDILYGENRFGHAHAANVLPFHDGADVYIRASGSSHRSGNPLDGGGFKYLRGE